MACDLPVTCSECSQEIAGVTTDTPNRTTPALCAACFDSHNAAALAAQEAALVEARARFAAGTFTVEDVRLLMGGA